jgi:hypothetical protein
MAHRPFALRAIALVAIAIIAGQLPAQSNARAKAQSGPPAKLMGKWVMDSTNGPGDHGLPKSETLVFSPEPNAFHLMVTEDDGQGPSTSNLECSPGGATTALSETEVMLCTIHVTADSVLYSLDALKNGQTVSTERGRLVVSPSGRVLRDQYDATTGSAAPTHHRHIYEKQ